MRILPILAVDFSMANLNIGLQGNIHQPNLKKRNDYLDIIKMITKSYHNIVQLPIFGFGAKT